MTAINIKVKVDNASAMGSLKGLHGSLVKVNKATTNVRKSFKDFNQTMFGATAFVGMFTQAFNSLAETMMAGSQFDRATAQFGKRFGQELPSHIKKFTDGASAEVGPSGRFIEMIRGMTDNSIDMMSAMTSVIQLRSAGVKGSVKDMAEIMAMAGTAAKSAGKDSVEGIKRITDFLKDGSLAHLQHLGLLRESSPALIAYKAVLGKAGGTMGTAMTSAFKLSFGMRILRKATNGQLKGQRDLRDTLQDVAQFFDHLRSTIGTFLGKAIQPLLESFTELSIKATVILQDIKNNKKEILFLAKAFLIGTTALTGFILVIGAFRLAVTALTSLVGGIPLLTVLITSLAAAIIYSKTSMKGLTEGFHTFGAIAKGTFQLIQSFTNDADNFAAGIGKMDAKTHEMLKKKGLLGLVENIARVGSVIKIFISSAATGFMDSLDAMLSSLGAVGNKIKKFLGMDSKKWGRNWLDTAKSLGTAFGKVGASVLGIIAAFKLFKIGGSLLGGLTSMVGLGGGGGKAPAGTARDPLWVRMKNSILGVNSGNTGASRKLSPWLRNSALEVRTNPKGKMAGLASVTKNLFKSGGMSILSGVGRVLKVITKFSLFGAAIAVVGTFLTGFVKSLIKGREQIGNFFKSVVSWGKMMWEASDALKPLKTLFLSIYDGLKAVFGWIMKKGEEAGTAVANAAGSASVKIHQATVQSLLMAGTKHFSTLGGMNPDIDNYQKTKGTKSVQIPQQGSTDGSSVGIALDAISRAKGEEQVRMQNALNSALSQTEGDKTAQITREEWVGIFVAALDSSRKITKMSDSTDKSAQNTSPSTVKTARTGVC